jgi:hypothetical protein
MQHEVHSYLRHPELKVYAVMEHVELTRDHGPNIYEDTKP